ncbi:hypothetical protein ACFQ7N_19545 [Streptomyces niveus]|uniref:hypothetical protein n=1 Tax=Streptomyces niveus TaxID=193462 RepID=UPI0036A0CB94
MSFLLPEPVPAEQNGPCAHTPASAAQSSPQVVGELRNSSIPNPAAIAALVPLAMPFHPRLRTRVVMALNNAGELLRRADNGELGHRSEPGLRIPMPPLPPVQRAAPAAS